MAARLAGAHIQAVLPACRHPRYAAQGDEGERKDSAVGSRLRGNTDLFQTYGISEREMDVLVLAVAAASVSRIGKQLLYL